MRTSLAVAAACQWCPVAAFTAPGSSLTVWVAPPHGAHVPYRPTTGFWGGLGMAVRPARMSVLVMSSDEDGEGSTTKLSRKARRKLAKSKSPNSAPPPATSPSEDTPDRDVLMARAELQKMQQEQKEREAQQLKRVGEVLEAREVTKANPDAGVVPEAVANRMLKRMIPFFLLPVVSGIGLFVFYFVLVKKYELEVQPTTVAFTTQAPFLVALVGITYAIMSSSWDPEREGSFLGLEEAKTNVGNILDGLRRSSETQDVLAQAEQAEKRLKGNRAQRRQFGDDAGERDILEDFRPRDD